MGRKVEIVEWTRRTTEASYLTEEQGEDRRGPWKSVEGHVVTKFGTVKVVGFQWVIACRKIREGQLVRQWKQSQAFTRLTFVHWSGPGYPGRTYVQEHRGRCYSRRHCVTLAKCWARACAT